MLPHAPLQLGLTEIKGVSVPAREVGGDFFNYFQLDDGTGRAARRRRLGQGRRRGAADGEHPGLAAHAPRARPGSVGDRRSIDRDIEANSPGPVYATLFVGILDPRRGCCATSTPATTRSSCCAATAGSRRMSSTGLPVGLLAGHGYTERRGPARAGRPAVLLHRRLRRGGERGRRHVRLRSARSRWSAGASRGSAEQVLATVEAAIAAFRGGRELFDDATMMAVKVG